MTDVTAASPHVIIAGGGPAGFLAALLLARRGIPTTVVEKTLKPDPWSTKSYSIVLTARGRNALQAAGILANVTEASAPRNCMIVMDHEGRQKQFPKNPPNIALSRPGLVQVLEGLAKQEDLVTIRRGKGISAATIQPDCIEVVLEDSTILQGTHVVGADGKWSAVRASLPHLDSQFRTTTEPSWGVHMMAPRLPSEWSTEGTLVCKPKNEAKFYIICAPLPSGECSMSLVCYDETLKDFPWLAPPEKPNSSDEVGWEAEYSARPQAEAVTSDDALVTRLEEMLTEYLPAFVQQLGKEPLCTAKINRRVSWLETTKPLEEVIYGTDDGRVVLIGDAAHAVTPSIGEGCNLSLESAVRLVAGLEQCDGPASIENVSAAFQQYSEARPKETIPVQARSAAASRYKKPSF